MTPKWPRETREIEIDKGENEKVIGTSEEFEEVVIIKVILGTRWRGIVPGGVLYTVLTVEKEMPADEPVRNCACKEIVYHHLHPRAPVL